MSFKSHFGNFRVKEIRPITKMPENNFIVYYAADGSYFAFHHISRLNEAITKR